MLPRHGARPLRASKHVMNAKTDKKPAPHASAQNLGAPMAGLRRLIVAELLAGDREVILEHDGQDYRLRITANGKLILTK
jgi:hemin uptake protein HemP